ncbi:MAG: acyl-CoA thioesterase [Ardenticatenaceae bacterium]|nr:acyl-CoA thioesterase [Ardenticatenaceae bacterium]
MDFPHITTIEVAFRDLDVLGHVNNAVYLSYLETARINYMMALLHVRDIAELPLILAEVTIAYKSPALFGEMLHVGTGVARMGNKSFDVVHRIETGNGRFIASAKTILVMYDYATQTTVSIPDHFRNRVTELQGMWQPA